MNDMETSYYTHNPSREREYLERKRRCDNLFKTIKEQSEKKEEEKNTLIKLKKVISNCCNEQIVLMLKKDGIYVLVCSKCGNLAGEKYDKQN